jgi:hypothetical protein
MEERFVFNEVAFLYDRARAGYPEAYRRRAILALGRAGDGFHESLRGLGAGQRARRLRQQADRYPIAFARGAGEDLRASCAEGRRTAGEAGCPPSGPFAGYFELSRLFGRLLHKGYNWSRWRSAQSYVEHLRSVSRYQMLEAARRETLLSAVATEIETHGGSYDPGHETHLYLAARKG